MVRKCLKSSKKYVIEHDEVIMSRFLPVFVSILGKRVKAIYLHSIIKGHINFNFTLLILMAQVKTQSRNEMMC